jgi:hypothetical protein
MKTARVAHSARRATLGSLASWFSNSRDVVKTDAAGRYALPADEESIVRDKGERE